MEVGSRLRIRILVSRHPGMHLRQLQRLLGISFSSTRYHVERMTKSGEIDRREDGGYSRLFPAGTDDSDAKLLSIIHRGSDSRLLFNLLREGSASQKCLCGLTGLAKSTVSERLGNLIDLGLIKMSQSADPRIRYELVDPIRTARLLEERRGTLPKAAERFIDLWDF